MQGDSHSGVDSNGSAFAVRIAVMSSANAVLLHTVAVYGVSKSILGASVFGKVDLVAARDPTKVDHAERTLTRPLRR